MRNRSRGAAMVEFAITLPLLLILVLGTIDGARLFATWNRVKTGAREGATYAQYFPTQQGTGTTCLDPDNIVARVRNEGSDLAVTVSPAITPACQPYSALSPAGLLPGQTISVTATAPFSFVSPFARVFWGNPEVKATVRITVQG